MASHLYGFEYDYTSLVYNIGTAAMPTESQTTVDMIDSCRDTDEDVYLASEEVSVRNHRLAVAEQQHYILINLDLNETFREEPCIHSQRKGRMRLQETKHLRC